MKPKTIKIIYWSVTIFFALAMLADGIAGVVRIEAGKEGLAHLGYPMYVMTILGVAKILGSIAVLQPQLRTIKEWAYAGFTINFIGAFASHVFVGDGIGMLIPPIITLVIMFTSYFLWKRIESTNLQTTRK